MRRVLWFGLTAWLAVALVSGPVFAPPATSEARGRVVDSDGNSIAGVTLTFTPEQGETSYSDTTNKKGRYFVTGLYSPQGDMWTVELTAEGYLPVSMTVESRTVNRVLVGDVQTTRIKAGGSIPSVAIRPMGTATIDFTVAPADQVMQSVPQTAPEGSRAAQSPAGAPQAAPAAPQRSAWDSALSRVAAGDAAGAVPLFEEAIVDEPDSGERRTALAKVLYQLGRYGEAVEQASQAIALAPDALDGHLVLYSAHVAQQDLAKAKTVLLEARQRFPEEPRILRQLAFVAAQSGAKSEAIAAYEALTAMRPDDADAWLALADLYAETGALDKSEQAYGRVVELDPEGAHQVFYNLGALIMNKPDRTDGETRRAIGAFRKAIERKPDYIQAHKQLGFALLGVGDRAGAKTELEAYVRLAPDAPDSAQMQQLIKSLQ